MGKKYCFSVLVIVLSVFILNPNIFAQDNRTRIPVLDELDEDFLENYEDIIESQSIADPIYYFNYVMYSFNDFL